MSQQFQQVLVGEYLVVVVVAGASVGAGAGADVGGTGGGGHTIINGGGDAIIRQKVIECWTLAVLGKKNFKLFITFFIVVLQS